MTARPLCVISLRPFAFFCLLVICLLARKIGVGVSSVGFRELAFSLTYHHHDLLAKDNNNSNFMIAVSGCYQAQVD